MACREINHAKKVDRVLFKARGNSSKVLELAKSPLDYIALPIDLFLEAAGAMGILFRRNYRLCTGFEDLSVKYVANVSLVGNDIFSAGVG